MPSNLPYKQAANVERRTWDKETYEARAKARLNAANDNNNNNNNNNNGKPKSIDSNVAAAATTSTTGDSSEKRPLSNVDQDEEKEEFQAAAQGAQGPLNSKRAFLKARRGRIDLHSKVGTSEIINPDAVATIKSNTKEDILGDEEAATTNDKDAETAAVAKSLTDGVTKATDGVGWHCKVCDCFLKDSIAYLDHINGKKHQRHLGFSMRTEKSTTNQVSNKLEALAKLKKNKKKKKKIIRQCKQVGEDGKHRTGIMNNYNDDEDDGDGLNEFEVVIKRKDEEALKLKAERARRREERKKKLKQEKKNNSIGIHSSSNHDGDKVENAEDDGNDEESSGINPDIAALMGFSSFGN